MAKLIIHYVAKALGVLVHIEGMPFGSSRNLKSERGRSGGTT